jgi:uncharacterized membrane protein
MGRPISETQRRWLDNELAAWLAAGILEPVQRDAVLACYETRDEASQRRRQWASYVLTSLAALFVGMGVLLWVGYNWQLMIAGWESLPKLIKLVAILTAIAAVQGGALYLRQNTPYRRASESLFLLGSLLYGAGIWLVAQVFHVNAHWPDGIWWWAVGVLPLAVWMDTAALHALYTGLLALWLGGEMLGFDHWMRHSLAGGCYSLPLLVAPGMAWCYRKGSTWGLMLYVSLLAWWGALLGVAWRWEESSVFFVAMAGATALVAAENHRPGNALAVPYRRLGTLLVAGSMIILSFVDFHQEFIRSGGMFHGVEISERLIVVLGMAGVMAIVLAFSTLLRSVPQPGGPALGRILLATRAQLAPLAIAAITVAMALADGADLSHAALFSAVLANAAMVGLALWLMRVGIRDDRGQPFAAGVVYLLVWAVLRYVDLFGKELGMLGGAGMFMLCGLGLFALSLVWRNRKEIRHE